MDFSQQIVHYVSVCQSDCVHHFESFPGPGSVLLVYINKSVDVCMLLCVCEVFYKLKIALIKCEN